MLEYKIIYGLLFLLAFFSALMVVASRHTVYSALYLVVTMVSIAGLFVMMNAQLAAAFQVIVYAGAIMVLFLFVIMLLNIGRPSLPSIRLRGVRWLGLLLALGLGAQFAALFGALSRQSPYTVAGARSISIQEVARLLLTDYIYAFEMVSVLLLIAVVGAVVLARRHLIQGADDTARRGAAE